MTGISNDVTYNLRKDISKKINRLPMNYFESRTNGEILSRITNDVDTLQMSLNQSADAADHISDNTDRCIYHDAFHQRVDDSGSTSDPAGFHVYHSDCHEAFPEIFPGSAEYLGKVNGQIEENFGGHNVVRVFNKENDVVEEFEKDNQKLYESAWKSQFFSGMMMPIMQFVGNLGYVMVALLRRDVCNQRNYRSW